MLLLVAAPGLAGSIGPVGPGEMLRQGQTIWNYEGWRLSDAGRFAVRRGMGWTARRACLCGQSSDQHRHADDRESRRAPDPRATVLLDGSNLVIAVWLTPVYLLASYGGWVLRRHPLVRWCAAAIGTQTLVVSLTHAEWDGRYLSHVLPLIYPLTAAGLTLVSSARRSRSDGAPTTG